MSQLVLSSLPAPDLVGEPAYERLRAAWLAAVALKLDGFDAGDLESEPVVIVCEVGALRELLSLQSVNDAGKQCMLAFATKSNLDHLAANLGIARRSGEGDLPLRLRASQAQSGVSTAGPESAYRRHALAASPDAVDAGIASPSPCAITVTVLARRLDSEPALTLHAVPSATSEGARALLEAGPAPDLYRPGGLSGRLLAGSLALSAALTVSRVRYNGSDGSKSLAVSSAEAGLGTWAAAGGAGAGKSLFLFSADSGAEFRVADAARASQQLTWDLQDSDARAAWLAGIDEDSSFLLLVAGAAAVDESKPPRVLSMLAAVSSALSAEDVRPMGDRVTVRAAADTAYAVTATLYVESGVVRAPVLAAARTALRKYADSVRRVGRMVPRSGLIAALSVDGVFRVSLAAPAADLAAVSGGVHTLGTITLTGKEAS